ncbi:MAG: hypothetical protein KDB27_08150 [Planctomycetales bacterium]|nr:hypothetical protein [Planctomycetales bacterium]
MQDRKPLVAFILSFVLPGAGLLYLRRWRSGVVNFLLVHAVLFLLAFGVNEPYINEHLHYVFLILAAGSGGYAHALARILTRPNEVPRA